MKRKELQEILLSHILKGKRSQDRYNISGQYGYSYNDLLEYVAVFYVNEQGDVFEEFFQDAFELEDIPLKGFFKSSSDRVKMNKVRSYARNYMY